MIIFYTIQFLFNTIIDSQLLSDPIVKNKQLSETWNTRLQIISNYFQLMQQYLAIFFFSLIIWAFFNVWLCNSVLIIFDDRFLNKWKMCVVLTKTLCILLFIGEVVVLFGGMVCETIWLAGEFDSNSACSLLLSTILRTLSVGLLLSAWCLSCTCISCFKSKNCKILATMYCKMTLVK